MDISLCGYEYCDANFVVIHRCLDIDIVMLHCFQLQKSSQNLYWFPMGQTNPRHFQECGVCERTYKTRHLFICYTLFIFAPA